MQKYLGLIRKKVNVVSSKIWFHPLILGLGTVFAIFVSHLGFVDMAFPKILAFAKSYFNEPKMLAAFLLIAVLPFVLVPLRRKFKKANQKTIIAFAKNKLVIAPLFIFSITLSFFSGLLVVGAAIEPNNMSPFITAAICALIFSLCVQQILEWTHEIAIAWAKRTYR